jgi:hypothetical protein
LRKFAWAGFELWSSWSLPPEKLGLQAWATGAQLLMLLVWFFKKIGSHANFIWASLELQSSYLCLLCIWDHKGVSPHPAFELNLKGELPGRCEGAYWEGQSSQREKHVQSMQVREEWCVLFSQTLHV